MNEKLMREMLSKKKWAVIGATPNEEKTGNRIVKKLLEHGYEVYCVNPYYEKVEGLTCYKDVESLPVTPDCVDFVVSPRVTEKSIKNLDSSKIKYLWLQPGSYDEETAKAAEDKGFHVVHEGACVMMAVDMIGAI